MKNRNRIEWIDICKGLGMILVVIGHTGLSKISQISYDWIYSFHMPLFYLLSGLCYNNSKYNKFNIYIKRRFKTLIFPFFILNSILFTWAYFITIPNLTVEKINLLTGVSALYFVRVLFISELWCFITRKLIPDKLLFFLAIIAIAIIGNRLIQNSGLFIKYILPDIALIYYALGNILNEKLKSYNKFNLKFNFIIIIFSLIFSLSFLYYLTDLNKAILAISGITTIITLSFTLSRIKSITNPIIYIGENTLIILALHPLIYNSLKLITHYYINSNLMDSFIRFIFTWILLFFSCWLFNKYIPWAIGKVNNIPKD